MNTWFISKTLTSQILNLSRVLLKTSTSLVQKLNFNCFIRKTMELCKHGFHVFPWFNGTETRCGCQTQRCLGIYNSLSPNPTNYVSRTSRWEQDYQDLRANIVGISILKISENAIILGVTGILSGGVNTRVSLFRPCAKLLIWNFLKSVKIVCLRFYTSRWSIFCVFKVEIWMTFDIFIM